MARATIVIILLTLMGLTTVNAAVVTLKVVSARAEPKALGGSGVKKGDLVGAYNFLVNIDNTGTTVQRSPAPGTGCSPQDAGYPNSCAWTSIAGAASSSPVYAQGSQANMRQALANLPDGRYLVSVLAEGYKLDGRHFTVKGSAVTWEGKKPGDQAGEVLVELQPTPLPDAQIQAAVFEDVSPVNSAPDLPAEHGLAGFQGHIVDVLGEVTTNINGDPLCSKYDAAGNLIAGSGGVCLSKCYAVSSGIDVGTVKPLDAAGRCPVDATLADGSPRPMLEGGFVPAAAAIEGKVKIPNLGPNRYTLSVTPPDGSGWVQTTTLEGNHDWDAWVMEGATGLDTEFIIAGEPFPAIIFGYVPVPGTPSATGSALKASLTGHSSITGVVDAVKIYVPTTTGVAGLPGEIWGGLQGAKIDKPIAYPWVTLTDLGSGDTIVWAGQGDENGRFTISNVPAGAYTLTWWDEPQNQILDLVNVTIGESENLDMGVLPLSGWWTFFDGYVFNDTNRNGIRDPGEPGLSSYTLTMRRRENSLMDRGSTVVTTDANGYYKFEAAYPMTQWLVMEAYDNLHYTTGVTYQADNQPAATTVVGAGVDVSVHPIIGLAGRMDWGKHTYSAIDNGVDPRNGGIVGTVSYDTTRNELDPRYAAVEDWQPSIPNLLVKLWKPAPSTAGCTRLPAANATCDSTGRYALAADGSIARGSLLNAYLTETWQRPKGCLARDADGHPLAHGSQEQVLSTDDVNGECIEAPLLGVQFAPYATGQNTPAANFGATVDGNYGFGSGCFGEGGFNVATGKCVDGTEPTALPSSDYLVQVDLTSQADSLGNPIYKVTREEDVNIGNGDDFTPAVPPSACAGPLHVVDVAGIGADGSGATVNPTFLGIGGSPYEGQSRPLCDTKLVTVANGRSIAPSFNLFTDVPIPGRHWFIVIDDLNFSSNPKSVTFGEKAGMPFVPVGIYDYTDRLIKTVESDYNGLADVLLPSTNRINCPTPSGVCTNLYRYVGNDPGVPGRLNLNYNPAFRTIAAEFEIMPGQIIPADLAPTQVGVSVQLPGGQTTSPVSCKLGDMQPKLYAVDRPYGAAGQAFTIAGQGFGAGRGTGTVRIDGTPLPNGWALVSWSDTSITITAPTTGNNNKSYASVAAGPHQITVTADNGMSTVNGLTYHYLREGSGNGNNDYDPRIFEVGPGKNFAPAETLPDVANHAIQRALDAATAFVTGSNANAGRGALVVVYPNQPSTGNPRQNPRGAYYENLIVTSNVKLQGIGPGSPDGSVRGSIIDGGAFAGDSPVATDWQTRIGLETRIDGAGNAVPIWGGNPVIYDGAVISVYVASPEYVGTSNANTNTVRRRAFPVAYDAKTAPSIDGFDLRGGDQQGFPNNINPIGGGRTGQPVGLLTQGGAIFANAFASNLQITNNLVENNGGAFGTIRIGTPDLPTTDPSNHNNSVVIAYNRVINNAGTNQAGGIGIFAGADNYQVTHNDICGNFSAEYGGGVSHVGRSNNGSIDNNRIYFNQSYDEGGGVMVAGALPATPTSLSPGAGPVKIYNNLIQANLSNDDGGGIRFLMAGNFPMDVYNNIIVNNVSTHEGGGVALNDAPNVRFFNNTVAKNLTTDTAVTALAGTPAPAGLATTANSAPLQATLPPGSSRFSNPLLFNNVFWDNRAGTRTLSKVTGLSDADADRWDMGVADVAGQLSPTHSILQSNGHGGIDASPTNKVDVDPALIAMIDVPVTFNTWRNNPAFLGAILISADLPPNLMGNYHLGAASPAIDAGAASKASVVAPRFDIDNEIRPAEPSNLYDIGADEVAAAGGTQADLSITNTDNAISVLNGATVTYTIVVHNGGPAAVTGATVTDTFPASLTGVSWTCDATGNGTGCGAGGASGTGNINRTVNFGKSENNAVTYTVTATVAPTATGTLENTASVKAPSGIVDMNQSNNTAVDSDQITAPPSLPTFAVLDNFDAGNANSLGANWAQTGGLIRVRQDSAQNNAQNQGFAFWNVPAGGFGAKQGAAFTIASGTVANNNGNSLILKASGGTQGDPTRYIRVRLGQNGNPNVIVEYTTNGGGDGFPNLATFDANYRVGQTLTAVSNVDGSVDVWQDANYLGRSNPSAAFTGGGRIGMRLVGGANARIDNFSGGTAP